MTTSRTAVTPSNSPTVLLAWINRIQEGLWLLTLFLVPLAFLSPNYILSEAVIAYVEVPKIAVLRTLVGIMTILWLLEWGIQGRVPLVGPAGSNSFQANPRSWLPGLRRWLRERPERWVS